MANSIFEVIYFATSEINLSEPVPHAIEFLLITESQSSWLLVKNIPQIQKNPLIICAKPSKSLEIESTRPLKHPPCSSHAQLFHLPLHSQLPQGSVPLE